VKKKFLIALVLLCCTILTTACGPIHLFKWPYEQPDTKWISEDGTISFEVSSYPDDPYLTKQSTAKGSIEVHGESIPVWVCAGRATPWVVVSPRHDGVEYENETEELELWIGRMHGSKRFTVEVRYTTFFEEGEKITFYRNDKNGE